MNMEMEILKEMALSDVGSGSKVAVVKIDGGDSFKAKMISLGIIPDVILEVTNCDGCTGPMAVKVNVSTFVLGRGMAEKILVTPA